MSYTVYLINANEYYAFIALALTAAELKKTGSSSSATTTAKRLGMNCIKAEHN